ncbi:MAG: PT domain-containing protein [Anaerolineae bacterium]|nr:PT domain-containing protein [Anaerolineae bacterium]
MVSWKPTNQPTDQPTDQPTIQYKKRRGEADSLASQSPPVI